MKNHRFLFLPNLLILGLSIIATPAFAEDAIELNPIEVQSSRLKTTKKKFAGSVTIITEEDIKKSGSTHVENVLRDHLSIAVFKQGAVGGESTIRMRGASQDSTLVFIDGARVNSTTTGRFDFRNLNTENIERIEILRGPQTVLWGSNAVGGVINIITKKGRSKPSHYMTFEGGSFGSFEESLGSSGTLSDMDYSFSATRTDINGFSDFKEDRGADEKDSFENTMFSGKLGTKFWDDGRVEFVGNYARSYSDVDTTTGDREFRDTTSERFNIAIPISKNITRWWRAKLTPSVAYTYSNVDTETNNDNIFSRTYIADLQNNIEISEIYSAAFGVEYRAQNGENVRRDFTRNSFTQGYFFQAQADWEERVIITGGFRKDLNDRFEDPLTYKFEGAYNFKQWDFRIRGVYATGFRAPTFNELTFPGFGNPDIKPEKSKSFEIGMDKDLLNKKVRLELTFFNLEFEDLITGSPVENIGNARSRGIEFHAGIELPFNLYLSNNYTWTESVDEIADAPLNRRPKHQYSATLSHTWNNKLFTQLGVRARSGVLDNTAGSRTVPGFATVRISMSYKINDHLELNARGENILDKEYEEIARRGTSDAAGYAGLRYNFN
ncbi:MAG: TonB-dependent receptor [Nitrospinota bacterium]